jgi:macrophage erythroblast attacher
MLREDRWQNLIEQFRTENFRLYQLSNQSVFAVSLQAGLSALKTTQCYRQSVDRNNECPVCHAALNKLAATLPFAHCSQSRLICHITGKPLGKTEFPFGSPLDPL